MGCGSSEVIDTSSTNISMLFKKEIKKLIKINPFYKMHLHDFEFLIHQQNNYNNDNDKSSEYIKHLISHFELDELQNSLLYDVLLFADNKMKNIIEQLPTKKNTIFLLIILFLNKHKSDNTNLLETILDNLINSAKINEVNSTSENDIKYDSGKLSFIILNFIQLFIFAFVYFFVSIAILDIFTNIEYEGLIDLFKKKIDWNLISPQNIDNYIKNKLYLINPNLNPKSITDKLIIKCFQPLGDTIISKSSEQIVEIPQNKINKVKKMLCEVSNVDHFVDLFFFETPDIQMNESNL